MNAIGRNIRLQSADTALLPHRRLMRLKRDASQRLVFLLRRHAQLRVDERREVVIHRELIHQDDVALGERRMLEHSELWLCPRDAILALRIERHLAIMGGFDTVCLPRHLRVLVTPVVKLKLVRRLQDRRVMPVRSRFLQRLGEDGFVQLQRGFLHLADEQAIHKQLTAGTDGDGFFGAQAGDEQQGDENGFHEREIGGNEAVNRARSAGAKSGEKASANIRRDTRGSLRPISSSPACSAEMKHPA